MKYVIESLAVIGACAIIALIGALTLCWMAATPAKPQDQINTIKSREERDDLLDEYSVYELTADLPIIEPEVGMD